MPGSRCERRLFSFLQVETLQMDRSMFQALQASNAQMSHRIRFLEQTVSRQAEVLREQLQKVCTCTQLSPALALMHIILQTELGMRGAFCIPLKYAHSLTIKHPSVHFVRAVDLVCCVSLERTTQLLLNCKINDLTQGDLRVLDLVCF